jgi:tetratricopeptide (TPR) repeat protein
MASLPHFLQKQLQLGFQISSGIAKADVSSTISGCLARKREWVEAYERCMREASAEEHPPEPETLTALAMAEAKFAADMWDRAFEKAASNLQKTLEDAGTFSVNTVCWHKLWLGYALECVGDSDTARALYQQAHAGQRNIPSIRLELSTSTAKKLPMQALNAAHQFEHSGDGQVRVPRSLERDILYLDGCGTPKQTEEALRCLGQYLGMLATRPENEYGTGPDVLWVCPDRTALCVDAKTDKGPTSVYRKDELGQLADHVQWVRDNAEADNIISGFVGPEVPVSGSANPPKGVKVACLEKFHAVGETLKVAYRDIAMGALPLTVGQVVNEEFEKRGLFWPQLKEVLKFVELRELKAT